MKDTEMIKYANESPNLTVLLPGKCNAKCDFCFWNRDFGRDKTSGFVEKAMKQIEKLPSRFRTISISGGEPTLSPVFAEFMIALAGYQRATGRFQRVVLTTNGVCLESKLHIVSQVVDHINISRHHFDDKENCEVFQTNSVPSSGDLRLLVKKLAGTVLDLTFNCVISDDKKFSAKQMKERIAFIEQYVAWASKIGANAVSFRKEASTTKPTRAEIHFAEEHGVTGEDKCPVCRGMVQSWDTGRKVGRTDEPETFEVRWKGSVAEPSVQLDSIYEAVIHADGRCYLDWSRKVPFPKKKFIDNEVKIISPKEMTAGMEKAQRSYGAHPKHDRFHEYMLREAKVHPMTLGCGGRGTPGCGGGAVGGLGCGGSGGSRC